MAQQPGPGVAKQGWIVYQNDGIFSGLKSQMFPTNHAFRAFLCDAGEVVDLAVASARRRAVEV